MYSTVNEISGQYLNSIPKGNSFRLTSQEFQVVTNSRMFSSQTLYSENTRCNCRNKPLLDKEGVHLSTGCAKSGFRHKTHDNIVYFLKELMGTLQIEARTTKLNVFSTMEADPDGRRPDLEMVNPQGTDRAMLIDVRVTNCNTSRDKVENRHQAMDVSYNEKMAKYSRVAEQSGFDFLPFIVSSTGQIDERSLAWVKGQVQAKFVIDGEGAKGADVDKRMNFWIKKLSFLIQRSLARSIIERSKIIFYDQHVIRNHEVAEQFMNDINHVA